MSPHHTRPHVCITFFRSPSHSDDTAEALAVGCGCPVIRVTMATTSEPKRLNAARGAVEHAVKTVASCKAGAASTTTVHRATRASVRSTRGLTEVDACFFTGGEWTHLDEWRVTRGVDRYPYCKGVKKAWGDRTQSIIYSTHIIINPLHFLTRRLTECVKYLYYCPL